MLKLLLLISLAVCCSASFEPARKFQIWQHRSTRARDQVEYSPELMRDAKDFIALIPQSVIDELVAKHMLIDSGFRKAIVFLGSAEFKQLQRHAELLPEVIEIISFLHLNETRVRTQLRALDHREEQQQLIRRRNDVDASLSYTYSEAVNRDDISAGLLQESVIVVLLPEQQIRVELPQDFASFVEELLTHLPHDRFVALINEKRKNGIVFPKFYEALRSDQFKQLLEAAMVSVQSQCFFRRININISCRFAEIEECRQHYQYLGQPCHQCGTLEGNRLRGHLLGANGLRNL